ncbi:MAG: hypothetical protein N3D72_03225, partial [Candidatus Methanomethyliaceae archaeon]|nr:hypothetical protein [Candidatus Methanomethyliaceae archaeon]
FEYTFRMLRREGVDVDSFDKNQILELFLRINKGDFAKEALPNILRWLSNNKGKSIEDAINALSLTRVDISIIRDSARKIVEENMELIKREGEHSLKKLMGDLMKLYRGKIDGKIIYEILREEILKKLA